MNTETKIKTCLTIVVFSAALIPVALVLTIFFGFNFVTSGFLGGLVVAAFLFIALAFFFLLWED